MNTCEKCGEPYTLRPECEPTSLCDLCCQTEFESMKQQLAAEKSRADRAEATLDKMRKQIRCIYCDAEYTAEQKDELADHILSCAKSPLVTLCREYEGMLDLMVDEFIRITALTDNSEIHGLCDRAMSKIKTAVPVITERDELKDKLRLSEAEVLQRIDAMREQAAEIDSLKAAKDRAEAACAELTDALARLVQIYEMDCEVDIRPEWVRHALSTDAGKGWTSPEKTAHLVEVLQRYAHNGNDAERAIAALKEDA